MNGFKDILNKHAWKETEASIYAKTKADVERALSRSRRNLEDFKALISPAAETYLEEMARESMSLTQQRFGKTIQMYLPLYLSNECHNICTYCGFSMNLNIERKTLNKEEIIKEVKAIKSLGYEHVLLVTGETSKKVGIDYFSEVFDLISSSFANISLEVQPLKQSEYELLISKGLHAVLVYQETYNRNSYKQHHTKGRKSNFEWRLDTPDRLGKAGIHKMGLGILIGLEDWRTDSFYCAMHLDYLEKHYWQTKFSLSFPRLRPCANGMELGSVMTDPQLVQLICAYRLLNPELELSMSTRESAQFRNHIIKLGITSISAESKTNPGGYAVKENSLEQFEINDERSTNEFIEVIRSQGYEAVMKDWDQSYNHQIRGKEKMFIKNNPAIHC